MIRPATHENIIEAAARIKNGDLVAFPTETVYGLGADARNAKAVEKIYITKGRPNYNPLIVHLTDFSELESVSTYKDTPRLVDLVERLKHFWPGPMSLILPKRDCIPSVVTGGLDTVAIRLPAHPVARELIKASGCPIAAPSANRFMHISPTRAKHVEESLGSKIFILDGGACNVGLESTVVSLVSDIPQLLRPGAITFEELEAALGKIELGAKNSTHPASPGMMPKHYSPNTRLSLLKDVDINSLPENLGVISFNEKRPPKFPYKRVIYLSHDNNLEEVSNRLFDALYELDNAKLDLIVIDSCEEKGLGLAIMDRIKRAAKA